MRDGFGHTEADLRRRLREDRVARSAGEGADRVGQIVIVVARAADDDAAGAAGDLAGRLLERRGGYVEAGWGDPRRGCIVERLRAVRSGQGLAVRDVQMHRA